MVALSVNLVQIERSLKRRVQSTGRTALVCTDVVNYPCQALWGGGGLQ